jgi:hypothetical protein
MKTIAVAFAALLALGASMSGASAAQAGSGTIKVTSNALVRTSPLAVDELSSRHGGHGRGFHGGGRRIHGGWHGHRGWAGHRHWGGRRVWGGHRYWGGRRAWGGHRYWGGRRAWVGHRHYWRPYRYGWRGYGWHRQRACWRVWHHGRRVVVCRWRRW